MPNLPHQNRICIGTKPAFSFWINISTVSEVRCDCQGLGLVARIEASILVFDTKPVLYWPVLGQIQFCSFDRRCKTCLDTKPVLYQGRFSSLTNVRISTERIMSALLSQVLGGFSKQMGCPPISTCPGHNSRTPNWGKLEYRRMFLKRFLKIVAGVNSHRGIRSREIFSAYSHIGETDEANCSWLHQSHHCDHYGDVIMSAMASQITSLTIVYLTVYWGADQRRHQSSASLAFVRGIHRWPVIPRTNGQ